MSIYIYVYSATATATDLRQSIATEAVVVTTIAIPQGIQNQVPTRKNYATINHFLFMHVMFFLINFKYRQISNIIRTFVGD